MPASNLKILREVHDYTQAYVAEVVLGMKQNIYSRLEKNPTKMTCEQAEKLAALYKVDVGHLLIGSEVVLVFPEGPYTTGNCMSNEYALVNNAEEKAVLKLLQEKRDFLLWQNAELIAMLKLLCSQVNIKLDSEHLQKINGHAMED